MAHRAQPAPALPNAPVRSRGWGGRQIWLVAVVAAIVVIPRAALICRAHNESIDDDYHLRRGLMFWTRPGTSVRLNDPPLGEAIGALPLVVFGCTSSAAIDARTVPPPGLAGGGPRANAEDLATPLPWRDRARASRHHVLYGQWLPPQTLRLIIGIWKAILYVLMVVLAFHWCRRLYGAAPGWMAAMLLVWEPNFAAFIHSPALDVLAVEAILIACYVAWRYAKAPSPARLIALSVATALAMLVKHTALILPVVLGAYVTIDAWLRGRPFLGAGVWRPRLRRIALAGLVWAGSVWMMTGFDVSVPYDVGATIAEPAPAEPAWKHKLVDAVEAQLTRPLPAGMYIGSVVLGLQHNAHGHWAYLFGEHRHLGWWYYFPVLATYKVPLGIALVLLLGVLSLRWVKPTVNELALLVPLVAWGIVLLTTKINIGFRHALPAYTFALLLSARAVAPAAPRMLRAVAWVGLVAAALHGLWYHPNYHAYLNWPRPRVYLDISDSNVDWGQSLKQVANWLDHRPDALANRPVYLRAFGDEPGVASAWNVGARATYLRFDSDPPTSGLLVISPLHVVGLYDEAQTYTALAKVDPVAIIGHTMLVYDLDKLIAEGFRWTPRKKGHPFTDVPPSPPPVKRDAAE